jgi:hypothetical protein
MSRRIRRIRKGFPPPTDVATMGVELDVNEEVFLCPLNPCFGNNTTRLEGSIMRSIISCGMKRDILVSGGA